MKIYSLWLCLLFSISFSSIADTPSKENIRYVQNFLSLKNLYVDYIDGKNGPLTQRAVLLYEQQIGWPLTGQISKQLLKKLQEETRKELKEKINNKIEDELIELEKKVLLLEEKNNAPPMGKPTTRDVVNSVTQSAKMTTEIANKVMTTYESYFSGISLAAGIILTIFTILSGAGFFVYFKSVFNLKKQYDEVSEKTEKQQYEIDELTKNAHANIASSTTAGTANTTITLHIYLKKLKLLKDDELKGLLEDAQKLCNRALEINPKDPKVIAWIYGLQGIIFGEQNKLPESCRAFKKALENEPDNERILCNSACAFALSNRNEEALEYLQKAIEIQPNLCDWAKDENMFNKIRNDPKFPCH